MLSKSGCSVLEKLSLPLVKHRRVDLVLVAQIGHGFAFDQMLAKDGALFRTKMTSVIIFQVGTTFIVPYSYEEYKLESITFFTLNSTNS